jgi:hypothetical protein
MNKEQRLEVILAQKKKMTEEGIPDKATQDMGPMVSVCGLKRRLKQRRISAFNYFVRDIVYDFHASSPSLIFL